MPTPQQSANTTAARLAALQTQIWHGTLALEIRLAADDCRTYTESDPYLIQYPRLSYLAFLLPRLHAFFAPSLINPLVGAHEAWIEFDGVPLKWHYPVGLLFDLFAGGEPFAPEIPQATSTSLVNVPGQGSEQHVTPWRLKIHYTEFPHEQLISLDDSGRTMRDWFINAVKEADYIRNGSARPVMGLGQHDSENLWISVQTQDMTLFNSVQNKLLSPPGYEIRHVPAKLYLPTTVSSAAETIAEETNETTAASAGHFRVVQALIPLQQPDRRTAQTLGTALNSIIPTVFPSRRNPLLAQPVLHGTVVPMGANMRDLSHAAGYTDGFLHIVVSMLT